MKTERHQIEAWVNELGKLEVEIPEPANRDFIERFLEKHPEQRGRFAALEQDARDVRAAAASLIGEIYGHFLVGSPSRWGLIVSLKAFAGILDESDRGPDAHGLSQHLVTNRDSDSPV